jgi:hypothetical protein
MSRPAPNLENEQTLELLWDAVRRCHAGTNHYRTADDPEARRALKAWEAAFVGDASPASVVVPFPRQRK